MTEETISWDTDVGTSREILVKKVGHVLSIFDPDGEWIIKDMKYRPAFDKPDMDDRAELLAHLQDGGKFCGWIATVTAWRKTTIPLPG